MTRRAFRLLSGPSCPLLAALILLLASAALYTLTLAPTLLWGDDAMFQRALAVGTLTSHVLWGILARLFARLPVGDLAFRANLASAVYGVGAVGFLFLATLTLTRIPSLVLGRVDQVDGDLGVRAALSAGAILAISHAFWLHAVRAEVYTLHLLLFLAGLWAFFRWRQTPGRLFWLFLGLGSWFVGTINHLLLIMSLPGGLWLVLSALASPTRKKALLFLPLALLAGGLLASLVQPAFLTGVLPGAARFVLAAFDLSLPWLAMQMAILVYQFPVFGLLAIPGFVHLWRRDRAAAFSLGLMAVPTAAFASTFGVLDSYVFNLPVYGMIALCAGLGAGALGRDWSRSRWLVVGLALLVLQIGLYRVTPMVVDRFAPGIIPSRDLPGRRASTFFLWPPKHGYLGAREFAEDTLGLLPTGAILVTDWTIFTPLQYLQDVEGRRPDVTIVQADPLGMQAIRENRGRRPLFLANADPRYYPMDEFREQFQLQPVGRIFALLPRESAP